MHPLLLSQHNEREKRRTLFILAFPLQVSLLFSLVFSRLPDLQNLLGNGERAARYGPSTSYEMYNVVSEPGVEELYGHARMHGDQSPMEELGVIQLAPDDVCDVPTLIGGIKDEAVLVDVGMNIAAQCNTVCDVVDIGRRENAELVHIVRGEPVGLVLRDKMNVIGNCEFR